MLKIGNNHDRLWHFSKAETLINLSVRSPEADGLVFSQSNDFVILLEDCIKKVLIVSFANNKDEVFRVTTFFVYKKYTSSDTDIS